MKEKRNNGVSRRRFLRQVGSAAAVVGGAGGILTPLTQVVRAEEKKLPAKGEAAEMHVKQLFKSLNDEQRKALVFPFDHELRSTVKNNWHIVKPRIGQFFDKEQQHTIQEILRGITSEDGFERFTKSMKDDDGGLHNYACALFGAPDEKFEFVLTGRHVTLRADGNSVDNAAFGGPIFYGHAVSGTEKPDHPGNVWWHQGKLANKIFKALDGKQQQQALLKLGPDDDPDSVKLRGHGEMPGISGADLSADQKGLLEQSIGTLLGMFRESDVKEVTDSIKANGGYDKLHMSFYREGDLGGDGVWDRWKVEGPTFAWFFRGSPHVHTWVNIKNRVDGEKKTVRV